MKNRIAPPEFWRFLMILFICLLHFEEDVYDANHILAHSGYLGVDFFLILSGFATALTNERKSIASPILYGYERVKKLYPDFIFAILLMFILWFFYDCAGIKQMVGHLYGYKMQFFFINALFPTGLEMRSIWFLSFWLIGIIVLSEILRNKRILLWGGGALSFLSWHYFERGTLFADPVIPGQFMWSLRLAKCVSEVILGGALFYVYVMIRDIHLSIIGKIVATLVELYWISYVLYIMVTNGRNENDYWVCLGYSLIILFSFWNQTYIARLLDNKISLFLGNLSLPIYLYHLFTVKIVSIYLHNADQKVMVYIFTIFAILIISYIFHQFVEKYFKVWLIICAGKLVERNEN